MIMTKRKIKTNHRSTAKQSAGKAFSYYTNSRLQNNKTERTNQQTLLRGDTKHWLHHIPIILAIITIAICAGFILSINGDPKIIQTHKDQNIYLHNISTYEQAAQKIITSKWLNNNKVTINNTEIAKQLKLQFPELSEVSVTLPLINRRPVIYISSSLPVLLLMGENGSMVVDARGVAILPATKVHNLSHYKLLAVKDQAGLVPVTGQTILPSTAVKFISVVNSQLKSSGHTIELFTIPAKGNELDIKLSGLPFILKMDMSGSSKEQVGAFLAAKNKVTRLKTIPKQYIDVRVVGRVYYK